MIVHQKWSEVGNVIWFNPTERKGETNPLMKSKKCTFLPFKLHCTIFSRVLIFKLITHTANIFHFQTSYVNLKMAFFLIGETHTVFTLLSVKLTCPNCLQYIFVFRVSKGESSYLPISKSLGSAQCCPHNSLHFSSSFHSWQTQMPSFCFSTGQNSMQSFVASTC